MKAGSDAGQATVVALCCTLCNAAVWDGQPPSPGPFPGWASHPLRKGSVTLAPWLILCKMFLFWYRGLFQCSVAAQGGGCRTVFGLRSPAMGLAGVELRLAPGDVTCHLVARGWCAAWWEETGTWASVAGLACVALPERFEGRAFFFPLLLCFELRVWKCLKLNEARGSFPTASSGIWISPPLSKRGSQRWDQEEETGVTFKSGL